MNKQIENWMDSYGVFCMAMSLPDRNEWELDLLWERACGLYQQFLGSPFNDPQKSELDCIQDFVKEWENRDDGVVYH